MEYLNRALEYLEPTGELVQCARLYNNMADTYLYMPDLDNEKLLEALEYTEKAIKNMRTINNNYLLHWFSGTRSEVLIELGRGEEALQVIGENMEFSKKINDVQSVGLAHHLYALAYRVTGRLEESEKHSIESLKIMQKLERPYYVARALMELGKIQKELGREEWTESYGRGLELAKEIGAKHLLAMNQ